MIAEIKLYESIQISFPNIRAKRFNSMISDECREIDTVEISIDQLRRNISTLPLDEIKRIKKIRLLTKGVNQCGSKNDKISSYYNGGDLIVSYLDENKLTISYKGDIFMSGNWEQTKYRKVSSINKIYL